MQKLLIIGLGDVAQRALPELLSNWEVTALTRTAYGMSAHERLQVVIFDLDAPVWTEAQLAALRQNYDAVLWTAPPNAAITDKYTTRMRRVMAQWLDSKMWRPRRLVYISTTGVYGDCAGAWVDEQTNLNPQSTRAQARVWDEQAWTSLGAAIGAQVCVLRAPGIYALERLPVQSVLAGAPVMLSQEDSFSNHIHADDLAGALVYALSCDDDAYAQNPCIINVCDDEPILMGRWFVALANILRLPTPEYITRAQMQSNVGAMRWSFMRESRRIGNAKLRTWGYALKHPSAIQFIEQHQVLIRAKILNMRSDSEASDVWK
ncbi:MAG: hypothetical protein H6R05_26 [Burkholderiaceae bacterium]|nr:hypothetical protein [Burkholderiaceae bacterium]